VPRGRVVTYGQVARLSGIPGGARTVGWALRALPASLRIDGRPVPWHRVVNGGGGISPRAATSGIPETVRQARALRREGIAVSRRGTVNLGRHLWTGRSRREH
jgi:methylated-DNA-protein-cysteine methyltransferase related protein